MIHCCIGIMAYNEAANIGRLLDALLAQKTVTVAIDEIVVVASGCTDGTEDIVLDRCARDSRIKLLRQPVREGKASAVNLLMHSVQCGVVVLHSADTIPLQSSIEALVSPMSDPRVGMVGGHPIPTNSKDHFMGYVVHLLWELHHQLSLKSPKMGELIAFRNIFSQIPNDTAVDEASIEPLIIGQGLRLHYSPEAIVLNRGPENIGDFIKQRRRIFAGHLYVKDSLGYGVSTMNALRILLLFVKNFRAAHRPWMWRYLLWAPAVVALEAYVRWLASYDYIIWKRKPYNWAVAESTKDLAESLES